MADTLAALLHNLHIGCIEYIVDGMVRRALDDQAVHNLDAARLRAAGVTVAPPSDPAAPLEAEALAAALLVAGDAIGWPAMNTGTIRRHWAPALRAALTPAPEEADR